MRHVFRSLVLLAAAGGALLLGEASVAAQTHYGPAYGPPPGYRAAPRYAAPYGRGYGYGYHTHDGFFLRVNAGFGYLTASERYDGYKVTYSGMGGSYGAAFGGVIASNLILYGEILGTTVVNADYSDTAGDVGLSYLDVTMFGFGPGIAYYLQPANVYFSGTLAISKVSFTDTDYGDSYGETNFGVGLSFMCGKEWWISRDWGIGIAGRLYWANMRDSLYDTRVNGLTASLLFSATYN